MTTKDTSKRIIWTPDIRKLSELKPYTKNPRIISEFGLNQLGESFDEIGVAQPININTDNTILSGHARWMKLKSENPDGLVAVMVPDRTLTPKQEEAVIIRMNKNIAGQWDFNILANEFVLDDLINYGFSGVELGNLDLEVIGNENRNAEWEGMPDFNQEDKESFRKLIIHFKSAADVLTFADLIEQKITEKTKSLWFPEVPRESVSDLGYE